MSNPIDSLPFRSSTKIKSESLKQTPKPSNKKIKESILKRVHDKRPKQKHLMYKIFSTTTGAYMHDLFENPHAKPPYYHIFINVNTRYAHFEPLNSKSSQSVHESLQSFINKFHPSRLISDSEPAFTSLENIDLLTKHKVRQQIVQDLKHNHSSLGIIDRFIRTIRDMNQPKPNSKHESTDPKYKQFPLAKMHKLFKIYNNTYHSSIRSEPEVMQHDPQLERDYILKAQKFKSKQSKIKNFVLPIDSYVRYVLPKPDPQSPKKRTTISVEAYKIDSRDGNLYNIMAQDGTVLTLPRFKLVPTTLNPTKWASTIPDRWNGTIDKIISYNPKTKKYKVLFTIPNQPPVQDEIPAINLRGKYPQVMAKIEEAFHKSLKSQNT